MKLRLARGETLTLATTVGFPQVRGCPPGANLLEVHVPSATLEQISLAFNPRIKHVWFYDDSATTQYVNITAAVTDRNTSTTNTNFNSMQTADFCYIGFVRPARGVAMDFTNLNSNTATLVAEFWNGSAWTAVSSLSDGTALTSPTRTFGQDGLVSYTLPTTWATNGVGPTGSTITAYWLRLSVDAALDSTVSLVEIDALNGLGVNSAAAVHEDYVLLRSNNDTLSPYRFRFDNSEIGAVEMKSASITSAANLNWYIVTGG